MSKFTSLCYDKNDDPDIRRQLRVAGLNGIKSVIRKTVSDDLQAVDIWDEYHMGKIIPSLLYNMEDVVPLIPQRLPSDAVDGNIVVDPSGRSAYYNIAPPSSPPMSPTPQPSSVAEDNLRELMGKATFGNIRSAIVPVLQHLDHFHLWQWTHDETDHRGRQSPDGEPFAVEIFRIIMNSIQSQHSHAVIQVSIILKDNSDM